MKGGVLTKASDVYSFGIVMYEVRIESSAEAGNVLVFEVGSTAECVPLVRGLVRCPPPRHTNLNYVQRAPPC